MEKTIKANWIMPPRLHEREEEKNLEFLKDMANVP